MLGLVGSSIAIYVLQWGRDREVADSSTQLGFSTLSLFASMGPRPRGRG